MAAFVGHVAPVNRSFVLEYFNLTKRAKAGINGLPFGMVAAHERCCFLPTVFRGTNSRLQPQASCSPDDGDLNTPACGGETA
jgi:hypothetical protein